MSWLFASGGQSIGASASMPVWNSWHMNFYFLLTFKTFGLIFLLSFPQLSGEGKAFAVCFCLQLVLKRRQSSSWMPRAGRGGKSRLQVENDWGE